MSVSPSSQKVDDFLSSLSEISQERLKENQLRQRSLQRDIDHLRLSSTSKPQKPSSLSLTPRSHGIRELSFNRSARDLFYEKWKDSQPEQAPELPKRSSPKQKPTKPNKPSIFAAEIGREPSPEPQVVEEKVTIDLIRPVARKSPAKPGKPETKPKWVSTSTEKPTSSGTGQFSFSALEERIKKSGVTQKLELEDDAPSLPSRNKAVEYPPKLPSREKLVETPPKLPSRDKTPDAPMLPLRKKSSQSPNPSVMNRSDEEQNDNLVSKKAATITEKPKIPTKPKANLKTYEEKDTEMLRQRIKQLSPSKKVLIEEKEDFTPEDHIKKLSESRRMKPEKPLKPRTVEKPEAPKPEALSFLLKLKPAKPAPPKPEPKPEALRRFETMKKHDTGEPLKTNSTDKIGSGLAKKPAPVPIKMGQDTIKRGQTSIKEVPSIAKNGPTIIKKGPNENNNDNAVFGSHGFKTETADRLASDLSYTKLDPKAKFQAQLTSILRANTDPSLNAPKKSEAAVRRSNTDPVESRKLLTHPNKSRSKGPKRRLPKQNMSSTTKVDNIKKHEPILQVTKPLPKPNKKAPPPIKGKKPNLEIKRRVVSGELFI